MSKKTQFYTSSNYTQNTIDIQQLRYRLTTLKQQRILLQQDSQHLQLKETLNHTQNTLIELKQQKQFYQRQIAFKDDQVKDLIDTYETLNKKIIQMTKKTTDLNSTIQTLHNSKQTLQKEIQNEETQANTTKKNFLSLENSCNRLNEQANGLQEERNKDEEETNRIRKQNHHKKQLIQEQKQNIIQQQWKKIQSQLKIKQCQLQISNYAKEKENQFLKTKLNDSNQQRKYLLKGWKDKQSILENEIAKLIQNNIRCNATLQSKHAVIEVQNNSLINKLRMKEQQKQHTLLHLQNNQERLNSRLERISKIKAALIAISNNDSQALTVLINEGLYAYKEDQNEVAYAGVIEQNSYEEGMRRVK